MKIVVETKNDCAERVKLDCTPSEWLAINDALRRFEKDAWNNLIDRELASAMLKTEPEFLEVQE